MNKNNFVKYLIFLGSTIGVLQTLNCNIDRRSMIFITVISLGLMISLDLFFPIEKMSNLFDQAKELDNIDLSFSGSEEGSDKKTTKKSNDNSEEETNNRKNLIDVESENDSEDIELVKSTKLEKAKKEIKSEAKNILGKKTTKKSDEKDMELDLSEKTNCYVEVTKIKRKLESELRDIKTELMMTKERMSRNKHSLKLMNMMVKTLLKRGVIDRNDINNINAKLKSKLVSVSDVIESLEKLMSQVPVNDETKTNKAKESKTLHEEEELNNAMKYSERPTKSYKPIGEGINEWKDEYTILNTDKWQVPMTRPPVCISSGNCKVCPTNTDGYPVSLKNWDNSRRVTDMTINKKWASDLKSSDLDNLIDV